MILSIDLLKKCIYFSKNNKKCARTIKKERNMKDNQNTGTKEMNALFLSLFRQLDEEKKEYIVEKALAFVSKVRKREGRR